VVLPLVMAVLLAAADTPREAEARVVEYLQANVKPGQAVVVSDLYNRVFTQPAERAVLDRLFNTFFKIPLFLVQQQRATGRPPSLNEVSEQFGFQVPGEADVLLRIMESDPRMPRFITRDAATGEIASVNVEAIQASPRFGRILERTIAGWEGKPAPAFATTTYDGSPFGSESLAGQPYLLYFWFTGCPPCVRTSPLLAELDREYRPKGLRIVGLNADRILDVPTTDEERESYAKRNGLAFTLANLTTATQEAYGMVSVFPTLFFVDRNGIVVRHFVNYQEKATLEGAVRIALE
jgi:thiol-disulfide isomerase/thioredoxin